MLNEGTFPLLEEVATVRASLLDRWDRVRPVYTARDAHPDPRRRGTKGWKRVRRCINAAQPLYVKCDGTKCERHHLQLIGTCKRRDCLLCKDRYPKVKARHYLELLGHTSWIGHYTVTIPKEDSLHVTEDQTTTMLLNVTEGVKDLFHPVVPAGIACLHWSGDSDPEKPHVHVHMLWAGHGLCHGEPVDLPGPTISDSMMERLKHVTGEAMGVPRSKRNGKYLWRGKPGQIAHCFWYALRPQGCGDDKSLAKWTIPWARTLKPFGAIGQGQQEAWGRVYPPKLMDREYTGHHTFRRPCACGSKTASAVDDVKISINRGRLLLCQTSTNGCPDPTEHRSTLPSQA